MLKVVVIADSYIPSTSIKNELDILKKNFNIDVSYVEWDIKSPKQFNEINRLVEQHGPEAYEIPQSIFNKCKDAEMIITHFCPVNMPLIDSCKKLKLICVMRGGVENLNTSYANSKNILWFNIPGLVSEAVAEFTIGLILAETRNIARSHSNMMDGNWVQEYSNKDNVIGLKGRVIGIVGLGEIGLQVGKRLIGFDSKLIGYEPTGKYDLGEEVNGICVVGLDELLKKSDVVTIHARLMKETENLINSINIELMKPNAYIVNTARAGLIEENALIQALKNHRLSGAALDVFETEPLSKSHPFYDLENITLTPHIAGKTIDEITESPYRLRITLEELINGNVPRGMSNIEEIKKDFMALFESN